MIIEDGAFIGSRSIIVEGVIVEEGAVIAAHDMPDGIQPHHRRDRSGAGDLQGTRPGGFHRGAG